MTTEIRHGRFSDGLEQLSIAARIGTFSDGMAQLAPPPRPGCFSDGLRGDLGSERRRGCYSDGQRLALHLPGLVATPQPA